MVSLIEYLGRRSKFFLMTLAVVLVAICWFVDYVTWSELATEILYLIPIALATWMVGQWQGFLICGLSAIAWYVADTMSNPSYAHLLIPYLNVLIRFGSFVLVSFILGAVRTARNRQEELMNFIVHDLRSPIANITLGLGTIELLAEKRINESEKKIIQTCALSCKRMQILINSLLDLARMENRKMPFSPAPYSVKNLVKSALQEVAFWAEGHGVSLVSQCDAELKNVFADSELTERILVNLLGNALQVSRSGSSVTVRAASAANDMIAFSVSDQGPGIPKEWTKKIFHKFQQVEARKAGGAVGSGLGLAFCQRAVEAQGGQISLVSEQHQGTTVTFTLPTTDFLQ